MCEEATTAWKNLITFRNWLFSQRWVWAQVEERLQAWQRSETPVNVSMHDYSDEGINILH